MRRISSLILLILMLAWTMPSLADDAAEMARKMQDPLANIKALMTDNDISFAVGDNNNEKSYGFQVQPVYAIPFEDQGFNLISRAVIPILGMPSGGQKSILDEPTPSRGGRRWGLSDTVLQFFFSPRNDSAWKWGIGPAISLRTRTDRKLSGPGWGGGPIGVLVGNITENISTAIIGGHMWGQTKGYSTTMLQPMVFYNLPNAWNIHYNNMITYNWKASSGDKWTVPLGLAVGKMFALDNGHGFEPFIGAYSNVVRPKGAADSMIKWGVNWLFP